MPEPLSISCLCCFVCMCKCSVTLLPTKDVHVWVVCIYMWCFCTVVCTLWASILVVIISPSDCCCCRCHKVQVGTMCHFLEFQCCRGWQGVDHLGRISSHMRKGRDDSITRQDSVFVHVAIILNDASWTKDRPGSDANIRPQC
jgi:hypothetical protein